MQGLGFGSEIVDNVSCFGHEVGAVLSSEIIEGTDIVYYSLVYTGPWYSASTQWTCQIHIEQIMQLMFGRIFFLKKKKESGN